MNAIIAFLAAFKITLFTYIFFGIFWHFRVTHIVTNCHYICLKYVPTKIQRYRHKIQGILVYGNKLEKYLKVCYHKNLKRVKFKSPQEICKTTKINVVLYFVERLWEKVNLYCGNSFPQFDKKYDRL